MKNVSVSRQSSAIDSLIAILECRTLFPKPAQMVMLMADAKAAADTLRMIVGRPDFTEWLLNQKDKTP